MSLGSGSGWVGTPILLESCDFMVGFIWVSCEARLVVCCGFVSYETGARAHGDAGQVRRPQHREGAVRLRWQPRLIVQARFSVKKCVFLTLFFKKNGHAVIQVERAADTVRLIGQLSDTYRPCPIDVR